MLRFLFPVVSLAVAGFSLWVDWVQPRPDSSICLHGGCRFDQTDASVLFQGATPAVASALLVEDPGDPAMWCAFGEFFTASGPSDKAIVAFDRASQLGPGLSPTLMRVANFDFTHGRTEAGLRLVPRILGQTEAFDELLYSYVRASAVAVPELVGSVIPSTPRVARSWLGWQLRVGTDQDVLDTWAWMRRNQLAGNQEAIQTVSALWQRKQYRSAQQAWAEWLGTRRGDYLNPELLANTRFENAPAGTPFDWNLSAVNSVEYVRRDGLEVRFLGNENLNFSGVQQRTAVVPGRYRFSAEISADHLSTDERPFFRIVDAENGRVFAESTPILSTAPRSAIALDFAVSPATRIVAVELSRRPSLKFDSKISGIVHIFSGSLTPVR